MKDQNNYLHLEPFNPWDGSVCFACGYYSIISYYTYTKIKCKQSLTSHLNIVTERYLNVLKVFLLYAHAAKIRLIFQQYILVLLSQQYSCMIMRLEQYMHPADIESQVSFKPPGHLEFCMLSLWTKRGITVIGGECAVKKWNDLIITHPRFTHSLLACA